MIHVHGHVCQGQRTLFIATHWAELVQGKDIHGLVADAEPRLMTGRQLLLTAHIWYQTPGHSLYPRSQVQPLNLNNPTKQPNEWERGKGPHGEELTMTRCLPSRSLGSGGE